MRAGSNMKRGTKETVGKKPSGLGKLMSVLHQNAASLVTTRTAHNGPDQILPATELTTSRRNGPVKLRIDDTGLGAGEPLSVPSMLQHVAESNEDVVAMRSKDLITGEWKLWTYKSLEEDVKTVAKSLLEIGLHRHHSVAIIGNNSPHWVIANLAAIMAGGISAGIHASLSSEEIARICIDCKADVIVLQSETLLKKVLLIQHKLPELKCIIQWEGEPPLSDQRRLAKSHKKHILSWSSVLELGKQLQPDKMEERLTKVSINQCCSLVYATSNKGVMLSHDNLIWSAKMALGVIRAPGFNKTPAPGEEVILSFLPLSHISTQLIDIYYIISVAGTAVFTNTDILHNQQLFFEALEETQPSILYGPPVIFERIFHKLVSMRRSVSGVEKFFIDWSNHRIREQHGDCVTPDLERRSGIGQAIAKNTVAKKYKESLGLGPKTIFLCRGGSLTEGILQFLSGFDIVIHSMYGQSECCSLLAANIPKRFCKFSSVGKPCPGVSVRLGEDGEVQGTGRNLFMGYLNRENDTKEVQTEDHWLRLGDRASIDSQGFLVLSCYPGDLITLFSSEEVEPSGLEARVRMELGCVAQCLVVGQGREGLAMLLSLSTELDSDTGAPSTKLTQECQQWFQSARFDVKTVMEVLEAMELGIKHVIQAGIDRTNLEAERASQLITGWEIVPQCFSVSTGELGQTGKVNRVFTMEKYGRMISRMYTGYESPEVNRKWSQEQKLLSHQLSNIVEDDEKSQRDSQDKELLVPRESKEERETEVGIHTVRELKLEKKKTVRDSEGSDNSEEREDDTREIVEHAATIEISSKHDQPSIFESNIEVVGKTRKMSRS